MAVRKRAAICGICGRYMLTTHRGWVCASCGSSWGIWDMIGPEIPAQDGEQERGQGHQDGT